MVNLERIILGEEDRIDVEVTEIESDEEEKGQDDDIEILGASSRGPKRARLRSIQISSSYSSEISPFSPLPASPLTHLYTLLVRSSIRCSKKTVYISEFCNQFTVFQKVT